MDLKLCTSDYLELQLSHRLTFDNNSIVEHLNVHSMQQSIRCLIQEHTTSSHSNSLLDEQDSLHNETI